MRFDAFMAQRVSLPAVITAILAAIAALASALATSFSSGQRWGTVEQGLSVIGDRLATIQRSVDAESSRMNELQQQLWRLDARIQLLERREKR